MTDPISDMIASLKNALRIKKRELIIPYSKIKENIAKILHREGFLKDCKKIKKRKKQYLILYLKYNRDLPAISEIKRISRPGRRFYIDQKEISKFSKGFGFLIISTSKGVMTDKNAKKAGVGGELICRIW